MRLLYSILAARYDGLPGTTTLQVNLVPAFIGFSAIESHHPRTCNKPFLSAYSYVWTLDPVTAPAL
ncbi:MULTISPECIES: hypothetical protein [Paenibacillus]|uniref:hypothetical protein n=1 Tax=Paenibacillus TaxID=44249 RepID=UPI0004B88327|nr:MULTISPECIES: hypothetical protein [Paenibacillus]